MAINDSNKTDQFDNEQAQLVHNDVAYQGATETTQAAANTILTNGTQKTQIVDSSGNEIASFDLDNGVGTTKVLGVTLRQLSNGTPVELGSDVNPISASLPQVSSNINTTKPAKAVLIGGDDGTNIKAPNAFTNVPPSNSVGLVVRPIPYEPATFSIVGIDVTLANLKHLVSIMNNNGSGQVVKIKSVKIINNRTTAVTGVAVDMRAFRITSLTVGTAIVPQSYDLSDTLSGSIDVRTGGTVGGLGTVPLFRRVYSSDEWGPGGADVESNDHINQSLTPAWTEGTHQKPIVIRAGQGLTIQCVTNTTAGTFDFEIVFTTENA